MAGAVLDTPPRKGGRKRPVEQPRRAINAAVAAALTGAVGGALIATAVGGPALLYALTCAALFGLGEGLTDYYRASGQLKPLPWRIVFATFFGAVAGALFDLLLPGINLILAGLLLGLTSGLFGLHWQSVLLGVLVGLSLGVVAARWSPPWHLVLLGGLVVLFYRLLSAWLFRSREALSLAAERVPSADLPYVVPFEALSGYIGADYFRDLARESDGSFARNAPDIGIVASLDSLQGPHFDPGLVDPLIREFYEHTSRFKLTIIPEWQPLMKPVFLLYKRTLAQPIGQANLPFNQEEAQRGIVSYIDTIAYDARGTEIRGWVRAFAESGEAIYVGVYTTFRHEDIGYVSVGFPLPAANFTATLLPYNLPDGGLKLSSRRTGLEYPGHYLSFFEEDNLTVLALPAFNEEIRVYLQDDRLQTDHRFFLGNRPFLTLYYRMQRAAEV